MNHYETVFILNPVLSEQQIKETVSKFEDFLTSKGAKMVAKEDWGLKNQLTKFNTRKVVFITYFNLKQAQKLLSLMKQNLDVTKELCVFLTVSLDKHAISWAERRREKLKAKSN